MPSATHATLGATGLTAAAPAHTGNRYVWFIRNGAITSGQGTPAITFSMPNSGDAVLDLLAISDRLVPAHSAEIFDPATGSFTALGSSLAEAREFAAATALPNGDVLVTGGNGLGAAPIASAELYSAGAFGPHSFPMRSARLRHTATLLASGQVLLTGGFDGFNRVQTAELYSGGSAASSFTPTTGSLATGRDQHTATLLASGKVLLSGGFDGAVPRAAAELFDPSTQTFSPAGSLGASRFGAGAALLQTGKVLIVGGSGASAIPLSAAELFDPRDGQTPDLSGVSSLHCPLRHGADRVSNPAPRSILHLERGQRNSGLGRWLQDPELHHRTHRQHRRSRPGLHQAGSADPRKSGGSRTLIPTELEIRPAA